MASSRSSTCWHITSFSQCRCSYASRTLRNSATAIKKRRCRSCKSLSALSESPVTSTDRNDLGMLRCRSKDFHRRILCAMVNSRSTIGGKPDVRRHYAGRWKFQPVWSPSRLGHLPRSMGLAALCLITDARVDLCPR
jgi:hypothetical protein